MNKTILRLLAVAAIALPSASHAYPDDWDYSTSHCHHDHENQSGTIYGPNGITTWYGNSQSGTAYGPNGITTWYGGCGGGTAYGPNGITTWYGNGIVPAGIAK